MQASEIVMKMCEDLKIDDVQQLAILTWLLRNRIIITTKENLVANLSHKTIM